MDGLIVKINYDLNFKRQELFDFELQQNYY